MFRVFLVRFKKAKGFIMGHGFEIDDNGSTQLMLAEKSAWHGLGTVLDHAPNSREAITVARMDDLVTMRPLQNDLGHEIPGFFQTCYSKTPHRTLGIVTERYKPIQNVDAFAGLDSLVSNGDMRYESCGALEGGKKIFILGRIPTVDVIAEGDTSNRFVLFTHGHDGKTSLDMLLVNERVVCANTLAVALGEAGAKGTRGIRHTGDVKGKMTKALDYLSQFNAGFDGYVERARLLAQRKISADQAKEYIALMFPEPKDADGKVVTEGRGASIVANRIEGVRNALRLERNNLPSIRGTWWRIYNAITDATDHDARKKIDTAAKQEKKFSDLITGGSADFKTKAFNLALDMSA